MVCPLNAQEPTPDFRTDGYSAPVHIPPRVPLYDPGLPESLNGKFNSTQDIRSTNRSGLRTVISDLTAPTENVGNFSSRVRSRENTSFVRGNAGQHTNQTHARRKGIQDRISEMLAADTRGRTSIQRTQPQAPVSHQVNQPSPQVNRQRNASGLAASASRFMAQSSRSVPVRNPQSRASINAAPKQAVAQVRNNRPMNTRNQNRVSSPVNVQRSATSVAQAAPNQRAPRGYTVAKNAVAKNLRSQNRPNVNRRVAPPQERNPQPQAPVQQVGLRQADGEGNSFVRRATQGQFTQQSRGTGDLSAARDAAVQFRQSIRTNHNAQNDNAQNDNAQLTQRPKVNAKPVSVLSRPDSDISLDPPSEPFNEPVEFNTEPSMEGVGEFSSPANNVPSSNSLRPFKSRSRFQDDESDSLDLDLGGEDDDGEDDEDESENPLRKSCDELRVQLLDDPITDIALDISPPGKTNLLGDNVYRVWRDQYGNELAQGTISDLRRGYVIIDSSSGGQVRLPYARLNDADWLAIADYWRLPIECGLGTGDFVARCWAPQTATWHASSLCHKPLYFENRQLERYGHTHGPFIQPVASTIHFFGKLFFLPYNTAINPPNECQYALGFYRPGNCAPWLKDPFPISLSGASRQATFWTGVGFLAD